MDRRTFVASSLAGGGLGGARAAEQPTLRSRVLGVWSLTEAVTIRGQDVLPWFGRQPPITGNIIYTASGWMSVQIAGAMPARVSREDFLRLSAADRAPWLNAYYAYCGTFEVDEVARTVIHRVVHSLQPYETATSLKRDVRIDGDVLTLSTPPRDEPGGTTFNRLTWRTVS